MSKHTPTPWSVSLQAEPRIPQYCQIWSRQKSQDHCVASDLSPFNAAFIVTACNAYERLVEALRDSNSLLEGLIGTEANQDGMIDELIKGNVIALALTEVKP